MKRRSERETSSRGNIRATLAIVLGSGLLLVGGALATPGIGILSAPVHARGTLGEHQVVNSKSGVHLKTKGSVDVATQQIVMAGGGSTGWHNHPGPVLVTVKSGALRLIYADDPTCMGTVYEAGDSFIDRGDAITHIARNESPTDPVEFWATYLVPGNPGTAFRNDVSPHPAAAERSEAHAPPGTLMAPGGAPRCVVAGTATLRGHQWPSRPSPGANPLIATRASPCESPVSLTFGFTR